MQNKSLSLAFCFALIISAGCIDAPGELTLDEDTTSAAEAELAEPELAEPELTESEWGSEYQWYCQGWNSPLFQYCLTRCTGNTSLHPVGSENTISYGGCTGAADGHCRDMRWGSAYGVCWGFHY